MADSSRKAGDATGDLENYTGRWEHLLGLITGRLDRVLGQAVSGMGLSTSQSRALLFLLDNGNATMTMLSRSLVISLSAATGIVDRLIKKGLVDRHRDATDRRVVRVRLTDKGVHLAGTVRDLMQQYTANALRSLSEQDRANLMELMETIADKIDDSEISDKSGE